MLPIVAETTQQALVGDDSSVTSAFLLIVVLVATVARQALVAAPVNDEDILSAAGETRGLGSHGAHQPSWREP
jgi:hypothetical protein